MSNQKPSHSPQRVRNVGAFAKALLRKRSDYAIQTNQLRLAFAQAIEQRK